MATALLLEREAGWARVTIGLVIGSTFLLCIPMKAALERMIEGSIQKSAHTLLVGALFATLMMSRALAMPPGSYLPLVAADALFLPQLILAGGFLDGIMLSLPNIVPGMPSLNNVQLVRGICTDGVGRFLGPPITRWAVTAGGPHHGQDVYSVMQFCGMLFMIFVAKMIVLPAYSELVEESSKEVKLDEGTGEHELLIESCKVKDEYGEYWKSIPDELEHKKLTEGPFTLDQESGGKKRLALLIRGESFREGRQHSRLVGSDASIEEQKLASHSHMSLIVDPFRQAGYDVEIFLQTREISDSLTKLLASLYGEVLTRTEMSDNVQSAYNPRKYNPSTGKFETGPDYAAQLKGSGLQASWSLCLLNLARSLSETPRHFSHVLIIRADEIFKVNLGNIILGLSDQDKEKILYANKHAVHGPDGQAICQGISPAGRHFFGDRWDSMNGSPSVSDQLHWFPFKYVNVLWKCGFPGHQAWDKHGAWVGMDNLGFITPGPFESDPSKAWNPIFKLAGRMEQEPTEVELRRVPIESSLWNVQ